MPKSIKIKNTQVYHKLKKKHKELLNQQEKGKNNFLKQVDSIIKNKKTQCVMSSQPKDFEVKQKGSSIHTASAYGIWFVNSFFESCNHVFNKYPDVDLSDVKAYRVSQKTIGENGFLQGCGGCYIPAKKVIFIKSGKEPKSFPDKLSQALSKYEISCSAEDIFVHELFHAVSHAKNRATRNFRHLEEEFVYTNTIDWFREKGFSDKNIVNKNFLPFVLQDILKNDRARIVFELATKKNIYLAQEHIEDQEFVKNFIESHSGKFVEIAVNKARDIALQMIKQHDDNKNYFQEYETLQTDSRFSRLDFD